MADVIRILSPERNPYGPGWPGMERSRPEGCPRGRAQHGSVREALETAASWTVLLVAAPATGTPWTDSQGRLAGHVTVEGRPVHRRQPPSRRGRVTPGSEVLSAVPAPGVPG
jgi:hypothetical protein